ncbi:MAG: hypothetical protein MZU97_12950 [Bacillus subtilis]|nr:hypothetical protein [Bacillus subtilis]
MRKPTSSRPADCGHGGDDRGGNDNDNGGNEQRRKRRTQRLTHFHNPCRRSPNDDIMVIETR